MTYNDVAQGISIAITPSLFWVVVSNLILALLAGVFAIKWFKWRDLYQALPTHPLSDEEALELVEYRGRFLEQGKVVDSQRDEIVWLRTRLGVEVKKAED